MYKYIFFAGLLFSVKTFSQTIDVTKHWRMNIGDSTLWKELSYNDDHWKIAEEIGPFERKGFPEFQNFGWARNLVVIPSAMKAAAGKAGYFYISLGKIYDADQVYFNGKLIGQTGGIPPAEKLVERDTRIYKVNSKNIDWDRQNLIAVRIYSNFHNGGLQGEQCSIVIPAQNIFHSTTDQIALCPLAKRQRSFHAFIRPDLSLKQDAVKDGGLSLNIKLPKKASVFYNGKFLGATGLAGQQAFFVPVSFISRAEPDRVIVYVDSANALENVLFADPSFNPVSTDRFKFLQLADLRVRQGSLNGKLPVTVSIKVINNTNVDFSGKLTLTLSTDINNIQDSSSHTFHLYKQHKKELDFTLNPDFSGVYQLNYILQNENGEKLTGTLIKGER